MLLSEHKVRLDSTFNKDEYINSSDFCFTSIVLSVFKLVWVWCVCSTNKHKQLFELLWNYLLRLYKFKGVFSKFVSFFWDFLRLFLFCLVFLIFRDVSLIRFFNCARLESNYCKRVYFLCKLFAWTFCAFLFEKSLTFQAAFSCTSSWVLSDW